MSGVAISFPNLTGASPAEQLTQVKSYLYQLAEQLNIALQSVDSSSSASTNLLATRNASSSVTPKEEDAQSTFNSLKGLIIKSADIVTAFTEEIQKTLDGVYVAQSEFGTYMEETGLDIVLDSESMNAYFNRVQTLEDKTGSLVPGEASTKIISQDAWVKIGALETESDGSYLYGMEIGQINNGEEIKFARYTTEGTYLYAGGGDTPVAKLTTQGLEVANIEISGYARFGGYKVFTDNGLVFKWVGRSDM